MVLVPYLKAGRGPIKIDLDIIIASVFSQNCACCEKDLKDNKHNSLTYAGIFVLGHYLFLEGRVTLSENCSLLGTDNVHRQIS